MVLLQGKWVTVPQDEKTGGKPTLSKWIFSNLEQYTKNVHLFLVISASNPAVRVQFHRFFFCEKNIKLFGIVVPATKVT